MKIRIHSLWLITACVAFWMSCANRTFFSELFTQYPASDNLGFLLALIFGFFATMIIGLSILCVKYTTKPILILLLIGGAFAAYFMDSFHILIDRSMIINAVETDAHEATDLLTTRLLWYVLLLGVLPSVLVWHTRLYYRPLPQELWLRGRIIIALLVIMGGSFFAFSASTSSFFREHSTRFYFNPANYVFAIGDYTNRVLRPKHHAISATGNDAITPENDPHRELIILVVGETARADHFSLNGYSRKTNPQLEKLDVVSFTHFTSCGTSTAISVPCMFSIETENHFDVGRAKYKENALDVLKHAGVNILWRDNNSSSKGVADRVEYQDYRLPNINTICDVECRDEGMLVGIQDYIDAHPKGDIMIVLHQMGNHGPAYYKRYPKAFEKFTPACQTNELADCSIEDITNAYDNAILYTDYFLAKTIALLKQNDARFETAMLYVSDHGESLGEHGLYLHGMPNLVAPQTQRMVPAIMWIGKNFDEISPEALKAKRNQHFTHDNIFYTLLDLMEINSSIHDPKNSLLYTAHRDTLHSNVE